MIGIRFEKLVVLEFAGVSKNHTRKWLCLCDCGNKTIVFGTSLRAGKTKSCGCIKGRPRIRDKDKIPTHNSWRSMKARCLNSKDPYYHLYGGRGIKIDPRWMNFDDFYADMGKRPIGKSLDRIDVNGNYEPKNCRWATPTEQARNRRKPS